MFYQAFHYIGKTFEVYSKLICNIVIILLTFCLHSYGQKITTIDKQIVVTINSGLIQDYLEDIENNNDIVFSYDPNKVFVHRKVLIEKSTYVLKVLLDQLFIGQNVQFKLLKNRLLILPSSLQYIEISGHIFSEETREVLPSALVYDFFNNQSTYADEKGFYSIKILKGKIDLSVYYLGNVRVTSKITLNEDRVMDFYLPLDYNLDSVVIMTNRYDPYSNQIVNGDHLIAYTRRNHKGKLGQLEVFENVRMLSSVQSGNEAQGGFYVRGGTPDQNLVLMDGIPLYESSHIGGLSSVFMDDMIRNVTLVKNGIPARFGGRLSSVLDVSLKDGDFNKTNSSFDIGLDAFHLHMDGPIIQDKMSFSLSVRKSILNLSVSPLFAYERSYDDLKLDYFDANIKLTYKWKDKHQISLTSYTGKDRIQIFRDSLESDIVDRSQIGWGTSLVGIKYEYKASNKLSFKFGANTTKYERFSRGNYKFRTNVVDSINRLDVIVYSGIMDQNYKFEVDYKFRDHHRIRYGLNMSIHEYVPVIHKSEELFGKQLHEIVNQDSSFSSRDYSVFIEDNFNVSEKLDIYAGLRYNNYVVNSSSYSYLQPRISIKYFPVKKVSLSASYHKMVQNIHFLSNPGLGMPSEIWIPSTEDISPQVVDQYGLGVSYFTEDMWRVGFDYYIKKYSGVLEFDNPNDIFYSFIINDSSTGFNGYVDWEEHIKKGNANVKSFEFYLFKKWKRYDFWISYNWSIHNRYFDEINGGKPFLSNFDRTHDVNLKMNFKINSHWSISTSWIYGSGYPYTLPLEEYSLPDTFGVIILSSGRNNIRFPAFHHLDVSSQYNKVFDKFGFTLNMGVYNVYNRFNPFYIYLYEDKDREKIRIRGVSLFPIVPFVNLKFKF